MTRGCDVRRYRADVRSRRRTPTSPSGAEDAFAILGLDRTATEQDVHAARRRLAKSAHPDTGGSVEAMQLLNDAADAALAALTSPAASVAPRRTPPRRTNPPTAGGPVRRDHPSFTIEALPVEAFEALLVVASWLGDPIDDDPPYALELTLSEPVGGWCRLDLVPDAGASTVSVTVAGAPGHPTPSVDAVRDAFVAGLNDLDWSELDP